MKKLIKLLLGFFQLKLNNCANYYQNYCIKSRNSIHNSVRLGKVYVDKNVFIARETYIGSGQIYAGKNSKVEIGKHCAIGYNVSIKARTHDPFNATSNEERERNIRIEKDISIGNYCWIGDNVFIDAGVTIGDNVVIGANAVVIKDIPSNKVAGGVPARILYDKNDKSKEIN